MRSDMETTLFRIENARNISCVTVKALAVDEVMEGPPIDLIILLDQSESMVNQNRFRNAVKTILCALDLLTVRDIFTLITFDTVIEVRIRRLALTTENKSHIRTLLGTLAPRGTTHLSGALSAIHEIMEGSPTTANSSSSSAPIAPCKHGVFLLTDGEPTAGVTDLPGLQSHVRALMDRYPDLTITTAGIGEGHNATLLQEIATAGNGAYNIVNNLEQVASVFGNVLGGLRTCVVQQARLLVPAATLQLTKFAERILGDQKQIMIGDIIAGTEITVVLEGLATMVGVATEDVQLKGAAVTTGIPFTNQLLMVPLTPALQEQGILAFLRSELSSYVERMTHALNHGSFTREMPGLQALGRSLLAQLQVQTPSPLLDVLIRECEQTLRITEIPPPPMLMRTVSNQMSQHSTALGTGRGILSIPIGDPTAVDIFSSPTQRHQSETMRVSSGAYDEDDTPYPHGAGGAANPPSNPILRRP